MISYPLMKRLGMTAGGLVPFFKCVIVYFVVVRELAPSLTVAAGKCAPVLCLMLFALLHPPPPHVRDQGWYASCVATGLALSMVGDALLVWPECFEAGMGAFALAHLAYLAGLGFRPLALHLAVACHCATAAFLLLLELPGRLAWLVPLYAALLASTAWRG
ncbi:lysoplasmalogenase TMEM86A, partial [Ostrinia nubilalis]